ncbi:MAG: hypothetical protein M3Q66_06985, partial [Chloroflexota bacterium]|nr:hypothetical protein [Chloroflexota bacterium]
MGTRRLTAALLLGTAALVGGCGGSPRDLGTVQPRNPIPDFEGGRWTLVEVEGIVPAAGGQEPRLVEVDPDGQMITVYFTGGDPKCYAVAGVDVVRRDPEPPDVKVRYGMRLGVMSCNAALASLAIRVPLD